MSFDLCLMDPAWSETGGGKSKRGADKHYPVIAYEDMPRVVMQADVWRPAKRFWLGIWTTKNSLPHALTLMHACGAKYVTAWTWVKLNAQQEISKGLGQYGRHGVEYILWGRRGSVGKRKTATSVGADFASPKGRHSEKPDIAYRNAVATFAHGLEPLEMFARAPRHGWRTWGDEIKKKKEDQ